MGPRQHAFSAVTFFIEYSSPPTPELRLISPFSFLKVPQHLFGFEGVGIPVDWQNIEVAAG